MIETITGLDETIDLDSVKKGDMPHDKILIKEDHIRKAKTIFPEMIRKINMLNKERIVLSVFGGSGVGKSEIASLLGYYLEKNGLKSYVLSGDNYPRRIPLYNDAERLSIFRSNGLKGMIAENVYNAGNQAILNTLWANETDADPKMTNEYPWLESYQKKGRESLKKYLGTDLEQDYDELNCIISSFKNGEKEIALKRMGKTEDERYYDAVDFSDTEVLIIEWTHGGNERLKGIDISVFLNSTVEETMKHRLERARDGKADSAFTTMVLSIEQEELFERSQYADIIISKQGELMDKKDVKK